MKQKTLYLLLLFCFCIPLFPYSINFKHIGIKEGLSQLSVMSIHQDRLGRMWFGTEEGLNMYDGQRVKVFKPRYKIDANSTEGVYGILGNSNRDITEDKSGNLYFCSDEGLVKFDLLSQEFSPIKLKGVTTLTSDKETIWFVANNSIFNIQNNSIHFFSKIKFSAEVNKLLVEKEQIWVGTSNGLYTISRKSRRQSAVLSGINVFSLYKDSNQAIWVATSQNGAYRIKPRQIITQYTNEKGNKNSISSNDIRCFVEDNSGNIWIGTFNGLNKLNLAENSFVHYSSNQHGESLSHSSIFSLCKDYQGNIWIGTYYGGVNYFHPITTIFNYYSGNKGNCIVNKDESKYLSYPFVGSMTEDSDNNLWICTEGGGLNCLNRRTQTFQHLQIGWQEGKDKVLHHNLKDVCYDASLNRLFIGTHTGGLSCYNLKQKTFKNYYIKDPSYARTLGNVVDRLAIHKNKLIIQVKGGIYTMDLKTEKFAPLFNDENFTHCWIRTFTIDSKDNIWIAGYSQLARINLNNPSDRTFFKAGEKGLGKFYITKIVEDADHHIYLGTKGSGMFRYETQADSFSSYTQANNKLLSDYCYDIALTKQNTLVIIGDKGITLFNPTKDRSEFIGLKNNLPLSAFNFGCKVYVCQNGEIFIGGVDGMISFREDAVHSRNTKSHLYFSELLVNNEEVYPKDNSKILTQTMAVTQKIELNYKQTNITLNIASMDYTTIPQSGIYEYKLEGFDKGWTSTNQTSISYTNLPAGTYRLLVRKKNLTDSQRILQEANLQILILPAIYHTPLAYTLYFIFVAGILFCFIRSYYNRMKLKAILAFELAGKERIEELSQAKIDFFTTVSHEFRTPLTLIISQMELLFQNATLPPNVHNRIIKVYKNALSMKELISELLTFQKLEQSAIALKVNQIDLCKLIKDIYLSFSDYANTKHINFELSCPDTALECWADVVQIKKVFYNLLSNAFTYTTEYGKVELVITEKDGFISVQVIDNGQGILPEDLPDIFNIFYRSQHNAERCAGSGIGLSLVKKIIELHHGTISVTSQPGYGSIFTTTLKKGKAHFSNDTNVVFSSTSVEEPTMETEALVLPVLTHDILESIPEKSSVKPSNKPYTILLVDDNEEMLQILESLFSPIYNILQAHDGKKGLELAFEQQPDLIISDVMMPQLSGKELCRRIKNNIELCHIPVVLLTALNSDEERLEGLTQRADDYISKPFNAKQLIVRCNNLIYSREQLQKKFLKLEESSNFHILATNPLDQNFLKRLDEAIVTNMNKEEFDINQLAQEMGISRSSLYAKFKVLLGSSPNDYLIDSRLKHAAYLLNSHPELQITEISYQVGFSSPRYFTKCFKNRYQVTPAEYRKETKS